METIWNQTVQSQLTAVTQLTATCRNQLQENFTAKI